MISFFSRRYSVTSNYGGNRDDKAITQNRPTRHLTRHRYDFRLRRPGFCPGASRQSGRAGLFQGQTGQSQPVIGAQLQSQIQLKAWREGKDLDGRSYTISLVAIDLAGNEARVETSVIVPHDPGKGQPR
jgi:hypothetical protein